LHAVFTRSILNELGSQNSIQWGHQLTNFRKIDDGKMKLTLKSMARQKIVKLLTVGADGIRSTVRNILGS
jgi:2-polyprenyl-6-methoxyphenol hydroxylase-like FAD-dependent oxidoreductase